MPRKTAIRKEGRRILDELHDWVFRLNASHKSLLGKAAHYTRAQWQYLIAYLEDGRLECSNNRALSEQITYPQLFSGFIENKAIPDTKLRIKNLADAA